MNTIKWKVKTRLHIFYVKGEYYQTIIISLSFLVQQCRYHDLLEHLQKVPCCITHQMSDRRSDVTARIDMLTLLSVSTRAKLVEQTKIQGTTLLEHIW